jgi:hypothetical protein
LTASGLSVNGAVLDRRSSNLLKLFFIVLFFVFVTLVGASWNPGIAVVQWRILAGEIMAGLSVADVAAPLRESASTNGQLRGYSSVGFNPVRECVLAVLDDSFRSLVSIIGSTSLTRGDRSIVNKLQKVLPVACNDGELLAVLTESIELIGVSSL